jgi:hypothetical protein
VLVSSARGKVIGVWTICPPPLPALDTSAATTRWVRFALRSEGLAPPPGCVDFDRDPGVSLVARSTSGYRLARRRHVVTNVQMQARRVLSSLTRLGVFVANTQRWNRWAISCRGASPLNERMAVGAIESRLVARDSGVVWSELGVVSHQVVSLRPMSRESSKLTSESACTDF